VVTEEQVESLETLARLVDIRNRSAAKRRSAFILIFIGTLIAASVLAFVPIRSVELELDLAGSEVNFAIPSEQTLTSTLAASFLGATGLAAVDVPRARGRPGATFGAPSILLATDQFLDSDASITLNDLTLPAGTRVWLRATGSPWEYRISLRGTTAELSVTVDGHLRVAVPDRLQAELEFSRPRPVGLQPGSGIVDIEFVLAGPPPDLVTQLPVSGLDLFRIEEHEGSTGTLVRQVSTIRSGSLYMQSIRGDPRQLRPGEGISFASSIGEIRRLGLAEDHLQLNFIGSVRGLKSGSGAVRRSLMPSLLEWMQARKPLTLLWATTLYAFTLVFGVLRWWRQTS